MDTPGTAPPPGSFGTDVDLLSPGPAPLLLAVLVVLVVGGTWRGLERLRRRHGFDAAGPTGQALLLADEPVPAELAVPAPRARFVVVGTRGCSDCARTLAVLRRELADDDGVVVSHVLAEDAPGLVDRFDVRTAPTVLLADAASRVVGVHPGAVDADVARAALVALAVGERPFSPVAGGGDR